MNFMSHRSFFFGFWFLLFFAVVSSSPVHAWKSEKDLLATLQNENATLSDKTIACRELAIVGTEASVSTLAGLLDDEQLSHMARYSLEPIPSTKVDEAFVSALETLQGGHLVGVLNSIANRGTAEAIGPVSEKLDAQDRDVAKAAAHCLGRLGTLRSAALLGEVLSSELAPAALVCARTLAKQGDVDESSAMLSEILSLEKLPSHVRQAALIRIVELQGSKSLEVLTKALNADEDRHFDAGLRAARLSNPQSASQVALAALEGSCPAHVAKLITLLGDLAVPHSLPAILEAVESDQIEVRTAALGALATLGNAEHVPLLLRSASDGAEPVAQEAEQTLMSLQGADVDQAILAGLRDDALRSKAILMVGKHRISEGLPNLLEMLNGSHQLEVIAALGETVTLEQLDVLGKLVLESSGENAAEELRAASATAFHVACQRMPDKDATVARLAEYLQEAPKEAVRVFMEELRQIGGNRALEIVAVAARGDNEVHTEYATQALGGWLDKSAAAVLLELAKTEGNSKYGIRALRGYIRLCRQFPMSTEERTSMCRTILRAASRADEKRLVLKVLEKYPSVAMLEIGVLMAQDPELKKDALPVAKNVAERLEEKSDKVTALLKILNEL